MALMSLILLSLMCLTAHCLQETCKRRVCHQPTSRNDSTIYFGLMLSFPDPLGRKSLISIFDDGHDIAPAAYLAVEQINNRSDLLTDYHVQLIPFDGGCTILERTVVGLNTLACSCEPVVGIIGPSCATSALIVGELTGEDQFSMVTIHYGEQNIFGNRKRYPFAFSMLGSNFINIQAFTHLVVRNNWTKVALLYSEDNADLVEVSTGILRSIKDTPGYDVVFASPIYEYFIPLQEVRQSFARVVIIISSAKLSLHTLCLAFHKRMLFPQYQWVFRERFEYEFFETSFNYEGRHIFCSEDDITTSIYASINLVWSLHYESIDQTIIKDILPLIEYNDLYKQQIQCYMNKYNVSSETTEWASGIYDAAWSLAFALNSSLKELRTNLTYVVPGSRVLAETITNHMHAVDFQGVSGRITFDQETGFNTARQVNVYQFGEGKSVTLIGFYAPKELKIVNSTTSHFIQSTFDTKQVRVSTSIAIPFLILSLIMVTIAIPIQVINVTFRKHSTIKATSPNLNNLIFLGCYLTAIGTVLYVTTEAWPHSHMISNLCNALPWFLSIGTTLVIGTSLLKTWRLYYIYNSSKKGNLIHVKTVSDPVLGGLTGILTSVDVLVCLIWSCTDPLKLTSTQIISVSEELPTITVTASCQSTWFVYWTGSLIIYKCVLTVCSFVLALFTRMRQKEFKTNNVLILSYILAFTISLGIPVYIIISTIGASISIRVIMVSVLVDTIICACLLILFLPSVLQFLMEKFSITSSIQCCIALGFKNA